MGYHAPSADEVYRYAFRLGGRRSIVDRFGFSIVLVNDNSPVCHEFLKNYCVDLCLRTADRIRFVFFSEVPDSKFQEIADAVNKGKLPLDPNFFLRVVDMAGAESQLDREAEPWRALRPEALHPLRKIEEIERQLNWECNRNTALPGRGVAMAFAQRLGIGRYVPCIVVFTEIGELHIDVMPMAGLSANQVFARVRAWIDSFYELNRSRIDHWQSIEKTIERIVRDANTTLNEIQRWRDQRLTAWRHMARVSRAIQDIEQNDASKWQHLFEHAQFDFAMSDKLREVLKWLVESLQRLDRRKAELRTIERAICEVEGATHPNRIQDVLKNLGEELPPDLIPAMLREAIRNLERPRNRWLELRSWWEQCARALSFAQYKQARKAWASLPRKMRLKHHDEFCLVLDALGGLYLRADPVRSVGAVFAAFAKGFGIDGTSAAFEQATRNYSRVLLHFLREAQATAPSWVSQAGFKLGEALPLGEDVSPANASRALDSRRALRDALELVESGRNAELARRYQEEASRWRDQLLADFRSAAAERAGSAEDLPGLRDKALAQLQVVRCASEASALTAAAQEPAVLSPFDQSLAAQLHEQLDQYDGVTESIEFPHRKDPLMRTVPTGVSVTEAAGLRAEPGPSSSARLRSSLVEAAKANASAVPAREQALQAVAGASPSSRLEMALRTCLSSERLTAVAADVSRIVAEHRTLDLLRSLDPAELRDVAVKLGSTVDPAGILVALGLYAGTPFGNDNAARLLAEKVNADEFDVFMAHNSQDKESVLEIARELRRAGIHPWIDVEQIRPGLWFQDAIQQAIPRVKSAAVFVGPHGIGRWQAVELQTFLSLCVDHKLPLIPVLLPGVESIPPDLAFLKQLSAVQFGSHIHDDAALARLRWGITGSRNVELEQRPS